MNKLKKFSNINLLLLKTELENNSYQLQKHLTPFYIIELLSINDGVTYNFPINDINPLINFGFIKNNRVTKLGKSYLKLVFGQSINKIQKLVDNSVGNSAKYFNNIIKNNNFKKLHLILRNVCPSLNNFSLNPIDKLLNIFNQPSFFTNLSHNYFSNFSHLLAFKVSDMSCRFVMYYQKYLVLKMSSHVLTRINKNYELYYIKFCTEPKLSIFPKNRLYNSVNKFKSHDTENNFLKFLINSNSYPKAIFKNPVGFNLALSKFFE